MVQACYNAVSAIVTRYIAQNGAEGCNSLTPA